MYEYMHINVYMRVCFVDRLSSCVYHLINFLTVINIRIFLLGMRKLNFFLLEG
jgi:hypothetical protein